jgi:uncharacterized repeat protein (TIGR01451 family)
LAACVAAVSAAPAFGEGSVDLNVGAAGDPREMLTQWGDALAAPENKNRYTILRVYARAGETIQMGSSAMQALGATDDILVYAPGTSFASFTDPTVPASMPIDPVFATDIFSCNADDPGTGLIGSRAQELAGPEASADADSDTWVACEFTAPADGIYPILMLPPNLNTSATPFTSTVGTPGIGGRNIGSISIWDVTVRDTGGVVQPGRLFSHRLSLIEATTGIARADLSSYLYTPAGYLYRIRLFDQNGHIWELAANDRGVVDVATGERTFASFNWGDSADQTGNAKIFFDAQAPQITEPDRAIDDKFPIFFNEPDLVAIGGPGGLAATAGYATAPISPSAALSGLSFTGAGGEQGGTAHGSGGTLRFSSPPQMDGLGYKIEIDLDRNGSFGDPGDVVDATGNLDAAGSNAFTWNGQDATGATPVCGTYTYRVSSTLAEVHLTVSDVENSGGTEIERLSLPADPALGDAFAASYNDLDPYKGTAATDASPSVVTDGTSGPGFHAWTAESGNVDFVDTWMRLPELSASGTLEVRCAQAPPNDQPSDQPPGARPPAPEPPGARPPATQPPAARPPATRPPRGDGDDGNRRKPRLRVRKTVDRPRVRAGEKATFKITVRNPSGRALRNVRVCDHLPPGLAYVSATPRARVSKGAYCWTVNGLGARQSRSFRLTVRALPGASGPKVAPVRAGSPDARTVRARAGLRVVAGRVPAGGVTG